MRLLVQSAMIFFGTLLAAGLLALGEPQPTGAPAAHSTAGSSAGARSPAGHGAPARAVR